MLMGSLTIGFRTGRHGQSCTLMRGTEGRPLPLLLHQRAALPQHVGDTRKNAAINTYDAKEWKYCSYYIPYSCVSRTQTSRVAASANGVSVRADRFHPRRPTRLRAQPFSPLRSLVQCNLRSITCTSREISASAATKDPQ